MPRFSPRALFHPAETRDLLALAAGAAGAACRLVTPDGDPIASTVGSPDPDALEMPSAEAAAAGSVQVRSGRAEAPAVIAWPVRAGDTLVAWLVAEDLPGADTAVLTASVRALEHHAARRSEELERQEAALRLRWTVDVERGSALELAGTTDLDQAVGVVLSACMELAGAEAGGVYLLAEDAPILEMAAHRNLPEDFVAAVRTVPLASDRGRFVSAGKPYFGPTSDFSPSANLKRLQRAGFEGVALLPIIHRQRPLGSVNLAYGTYRPPQPEQRDLLESLTAQAGVAIARLRAEAARWRMQRNLEGLFNDSHDFVIMAGLDGMVLYCNPVVTRRLGYGPAELARMELADLFAASGRESLEHALRRAAGGETVSSGVPLSTRSETQIAAETRLSRTTWDGAGAICVVARDVTAQRIAEAQLRQSELRYRGLVESQNDLIVRVDPDGRFTFVNDAYCRTFGKTAGELYRQTYHPLVHEEDLPRTLEAMKKLEQPPHRVTLEQRAKTVDGWRWLFWEDVAIKDERGETVEIQAVGRDITEYKRALARAERSLALAERARAAVESAREALAEALEPTTEETGDLGAAAEDHGREPSSSPSQPENQG